MGVPPGAYVQLAPQIPLPGTPAMLGGYEQDTAQVIVADLACTGIGLAQDASGHLVLHHSCAATRSISGAPLLARMPGGSWAVAGVASLAGVGVSDGYAVPVAAISPELLVGPAALH